MDPRCPQCPDARARRREDEGTRAHRVAALLASVRAGTYVVDVEALATVLLADEARAIRSGR